MVNGLITCIHHLHLSNGERKRERKKERREEKNLLVPLITTQNVVDVEDVVAVLVVVAVVLDALAGLGQHAARVARRLVLEGRVADAVCGGQMRGQRLEGLAGVRRKEGSEEVEKEVGKEEEEYVR
jgi:hypothetical protein